MQTFDVFFVDSLNVLYKTQWGFSVICDALSLMGRHHNGRQSTIGTAMKVLVGQSPGHLTVNELHDRTNDKYYAWLKAEFGSGLIDAKTLLV